jgi:diguanylate cyclase
MMVDADHFKHYNDQYGHQQGDKALMHLADILRETATRAMDFVARWGGEEFAVLLPNSNQRAGLKVGEDLRKNVECAEFPLGGGTLTRMTVSIGVMSQIPQRDSVLDEFISGADKALYAAKAAGRNRVCLYDANVQAGWGRAI